MPPSAAGLAAAVGSRGRDMLLLWRGSAHHDQGEKDDQAAEYQWEGGRREYNEYRK